MNSSSKATLTHGNSAGNEDNTVAFLKYLQSLSEDSTRLVIIWDGASHHRSAVVQEFLRETVHPQVRSIVSQV